MSADRASDEDPLVRSHGYERTCFPDKTTASTIDIHHDVYSKGRGPVVLVMHELPGLTPAVVGFADRLVASGFRVVLPLLFGKPLESAAFRNYRQLCVGREFNRLRAGESSPITAWLRALVDSLGAPVGVVGLCLTGGFVIPLIMRPGVKAAVAAEPAIPLSLGYAWFGWLGLGRGDWMSQLNVSDDEIAGAAIRAGTKNVPVLALRFTADRLCPRERVERLREAFGDQLEVHELSCSSWARRVFNPPHAVLTEEYDRSADPAHPTRPAFDRVVHFLRSALAVRGPGI